MENKLIKFIHWTFYIGFIVFAGVFVYHLFVFPCRIPSHYYGTLVMSMVLYILMEMTLIDSNKERQEKKETRGLSIILGIVILSFIVVILTSSCSHNGYGCHGRSKSITGEGTRKKLAH